MKNHLLQLIRLYQRHISPIWTKSPLFFASTCLHYPSCSEYAISSISEFGVFKGTILGIRRVLSCNSFIRLKKSNII